MRPGFPLLVVLAVHILPQLRYELQFIREQPTDQTISFGHMFEIDWFTRQLFQSRPRVPCSQPVQVGFCPAEKVYFYAYAIPLASADKSLAIGRAQSLRYGA
jgi:hypothetical protein